MMDLHQDLQHIRALDDESLLRSLKRHAASSNRLNALVLAHLAEVDARGAYRLWACQTLAAYCVYELRLSEDEAQRRCRAARVMRQFPVLFEMIADASIHLTGILMLAPYLTPDNHQGVLARARYRRKREIERLVAEIAPACDVPALMEPIRAVNMGSHTIPRKSWAALTESALGWVRQLHPGDGPASAPSVTPEHHERLLADLQHEDAESSEETPAETIPGTAAETPACTPRSQAQNPAAEHAERENESAQHAENAVAENVENVSAGYAQNRSVECAKNDSAEHAENAVAEHAENAAAEHTQHPNCRVPANTRYRVQLTADQAYVDLAERARALLWHQLPNGDLAELHRRALEALIEKLLRRKRGAPTQPAAVHPSSAVDAHADAPARNMGSQGDPSNSFSESKVSVPAPSTGSRSEPTTPSANTLQTSVAVRPRPRSRHIPVAVRREVWERDGGRCAFVDARGIRCRATSSIEFHHEHPHALGGASTVANIQLRCRAHNELAAEHDFGCDFVRTIRQQKRSER